MVKDDAADDEIHAGHDNLNEPPVDRGRSPYLDIVMDPWNASIDILNRRFIVKQGPKRVDQVCKTGQNWCEKALLLDPTVKLCLPESSLPLLDIICPGYVLLYIPPGQFGVNLTII